jgi:opacity protein-like surface antigen
MPKAIATAKKNFFIFCSLSHKNTYLPEIKSISTIKKDRNFTIETDLKNIRLCKMTYFVNIKNRFPMRKISKAIVAILVVLLIHNITIAQVREVIEAIKPAKAYDGIPILKKRSQILQVGIGAPNNVASLINAPSTAVGGILGTLGLSGQTTSATSSKVGPFNLDYEYMIKENLGIGIGFSYASATETFSIPLIVPTKTVANVQATSFLVSTIYHFYITNKLDPYSKVSIGATLWKASYTNENGSDAGKLPLPTPIAYRALIGLRYFVSPNIAPYGEASYSNLKFSAAIGLAVKIN